MFECGLEDINLKAAKRTGYTGKEEAAPEEEQRAPPLRNPPPSSSHRPHPSHRYSNTHSHLGVESETVSVDASHASGLGNSADDEASSAAGSRETLNSDKDEEEDGEEVG